MISRFADYYEVIFPDGTKRIQFNDGYYCIFFADGDIRQFYPHGVTVYYFKKDQVTQT